MFQVLLISFCQSGVWGINKLGTKFSATHYYSFVLIGGGGYQDIGEFNLCVIGGLNMHGLIGHVMIELDATPTLNGFFYRVRNPQIGQATVGISCYS